MDGRNQQLSPHHAARVGALHSWLVGDESSFIRDGSRDTEVNCVCMMRTHRSVRDRGTIKRIVQEVMFTSTSVCTIMPALQPYSLLH